MASSLTDWHEALQQLPPEDAQRINKVRSVRGEGRLLSWCGVYRTYSPSHIQTGSTQTCGRQAATLPVAPAPCHVAPFHSLCTRSGVAWCCMACQASSDTLCGASIGVCVCWPQGIVWLHNIMWLSGLHNIVAWHTHTHTHMHIPDIRYWQRRLVDRNRAMDKVCSVVGWIGCTEQHWFGHRHAQWIVVFVSTHAQGMFLVCVWVLFVYGCHMGIFCLSRVLFAGLLFV